MSSSKPGGKYELMYWPLPFRGCFVSYLFAYCDVPFVELSDFDEVSDQRSQPCDEQGVPFMGPPVLRNLETGQSLSQMPAIVLYVAGELDLLPKNRFAIAGALKILMDCNDILMEICRYNGSMMWERDAWVEFRSQRFARWLEILEESLERGLFGGETVTFADIAVYALLGNMTRCLPQLAVDVAANAPLTDKLCQQIGSRPSLARHVKAQQEAYGLAYCGGQIEQSIRAMLKLDAH